MTTPSAETRTRDHYEEFPYDVGVDDPEVYVKAGSPLGEFLDSVHGGRLLDLGCGPGHLLPSYARRADSVTAVELSPRSAALARARIERLGRSVKATTTIVEGSALTLPFEDASFDHVTATGSLHHTGDAERGFAELCRVLRPGGTAFVSLYGHGSYYERAYRTVGRLARRSQRSAVLDRLTNRGLLFAPFALYLWGGRLVTHRTLPRLSLDQIRNYYADQLLNPTVSFHTIAEVARWAERRQSNVAWSRTTHAGALIHVCIEKGAS